VLKALLSSNQPTNHMHDVCFKGFFSVFTTSSDENQLITLETNYVLGILIHMPLLVDMQMC